MDENMHQINALKVTNASECAT